jgi:hypothetical protein
VAHGKQDTVSAFWRVISAPLSGNLRSSERGNVISKERERNALYNTTIPLTYLVTMHEIAFLDKMH